MHIPSPLDVILGDGFLRQCGAHLEYDKKAIVITSNKRQHTIYTIESRAEHVKKVRPPIGDTSSTGPILLTIIQVKG
jgi:hypothetical protein